MKKVKQYQPKEVTPKLLEQIWEDRGGINGPVGPANLQVKDAHSHSETTWQCKYCTGRFFFRAEVVCKFCGLCQSCGIYHENREDTSCLCGNRLPEGSPEIIRRRIRPA